MGRAIEITSFTPAYRAGQGTPLVCLHGFLDTWRVWELVLPALERQHDVLALTLAGHAGGPPLPETVTPSTSPSTSNTRLTRRASRPRTSSAIRSAATLRFNWLPAGGRAPLSRSPPPAVGRSETSPTGSCSASSASLQAQAVALAPRADALLSTAQGRRRATMLQTVNYAHIPADLLAHQLIGIARCTAAGPAIDAVLASGWNLEAERIMCPVRIVWGTEDRLLPWPTAAARYRNDWLPHADWVVLDDVGHTPQLDVPTETSQLILGVTSFG